MREAIKHDRARIQAGRISSLGLMELSRQRLRPNIVEASTQSCPHCQGTGYMRTTESAALQVIRAIEEEGIRGRSTHMAVRVPAEVGLYILNQKRSNLTEIEASYKLRVEIRTDSDLLAPAFEILRLAEAEVSEGVVIPIRPDAERPEPVAKASGDVRATADRPPRRRRGRRGGRRRSGGRFGRERSETATEAIGEKLPTQTGSPAEPGEKAAPPSGRIKKSDAAAEQPPATDEAAGTPAKGAKARPTSGPKAAGKKTASAASKPAKRKTASTTTTKKATAAKSTAKSVAGARKTATKATDAKAKKPAARKASAKKPGATKASAKKVAAKPVAVKVGGTKQAAKEAGPKRMGWWQKTFSQTGE